MSAEPILPDNTIEAPGARAPLVLGGNDFRSVTEKVCSIVERPRLPRACIIATFVPVAAELTVRPARSGSAAPAPS